MIQVLKSYQTLSQEQRTIIKSGELKGTSPTAHWRQVLEPLVRLDDQLPGVRKNLEMLLWVYAGSFGLSLLFYVAILAGWGEISFMGLTLIGMHVALLPFAYWLLSFRSKVKGMDLDDRLGSCVLPFIDRMHQGTPDKIVTLRMDAAGIDWEAEMKSACPVGGTYRMEPVDLDWLAIEINLGGSNLAIHVTDHLEGDAETIEKPIGDETMYMCVTHFENTRKITTTLRLSPGAPVPHDLPNETQVLTKGNVNVIAYEWEKNTFEPSPEIFSPHLEKGVKMVLTGQHEGTPAAQLLKGFL